MDKEEKNRTTKVREVVKKGQNFEVTGKRSKYFSKADAINLAQFLVKLVQQCAEFSASAWEGIHSSGWKIFILVGRYNDCPLALKLSIN